MSVCVQVYILSFQSCISLLICYCCCYFLHIISHHIINIYIHKRAKGREGGGVSIRVFDLVISNFIQFNILYHIIVVAVSCVCHLMRARSIYLRLHFMKWNKTRRRKWTKKNLLLHTSWAASARAHTYIHDDIVFAFSILGIIDTPTYIIAYIESHLTCSRTLVETTWERERERGGSRHEQMSLFVFSFSLSLSHFKYDTIFFIWHMSHCARTILVYIFWQEVNLFNMTFNI